MSMQIDREKQTKILVVDDDEHNRKFYLQVLKKNGYAADEAASGEKALEYIQQNTYELVLSDLQMYRVGGLDVLETAKKKDPHTQVIILTGYGSISTAVKAMQNGAFDYLSKPVNKQDFLLRVTKALSQYEMQVRLEKQQESLEAHQLMLERDLNLAKKVQDSLIPSDLKNDKIKIGIEYHPMIGIGGDFCGIYPNNEKHIHVNMIDVTGHGISAALIVNRVYNELNGLLKSNLMPQDVLGGINEFFYHTFGNMGLYLTMMSIQLDFEQQVLHYAGGAHPSALLCRSSEKRVMQLASQNTIIGFQHAKFINFVQDSLEFLPGDRIIIYTDGILEADDAHKNQFGMQRLLDTVHKNIAKPLSQIGKNIIKDVKKFCVGEHRDDIMLLVVEIQ